MTTGRRNYRNKRGEKLKGVTTILGVLGKPALIGWGYNQGLENYDRLAQLVVGILNAEKPVRPGRKLALLDKEVRGFRVSPLYDKRDKAADAGTLAHLMVEKYLLGQPPINLAEYLHANRPPDLDREDLANWKDDVRWKAEGCYSTFKSWAEGHKFQVVCVEEELVSEEWQYGGTIDLGAVIGQTDAGITMSDLKTSKGIYLTHKIQLAAYGKLWSENHPDMPVVKYQILAPHPNGHMQQESWNDLSHELAIFKACLEIDKHLTATGQKL
uniref:PD-(D/E)XK endonuclease-like domain-containing protein n=1 Tax=viral metagenome TaxID=1070528 RepID=A0A6M3KWX5_9ZZZZ